MSRAKGNAAPAWIANYLRPWFPAAEKTPNGRKGIDIQNTPGLAIEVKTGAQLRTAWLDQALGYVTDADVPLLIWLRPSQGQQKVGQALALLALPLDEMMTVLEDSGWAPRPAPLKIVGD